LGFSKINFRTSAEEEKKRAAWRKRQQRAREKKKKAKLDVKDNCDHIIVQGPSTAPASLLQLQGHDMEIDLPTMEAQISPSHLHSIERPSPTPMGSPIMNSNPSPATISDVLPASYKTKRVVYVPDPTQHISKRSLASKKIGWRSFRISVKELALVEKLEGLVVFKGKKIKEASHPYPHEVLMHEWVRLHFHLFK
jgi:hypothetical protein